MLNTILEQNTLGLPVKGCRCNRTEVVIPRKHPFKSNYLKTRI